MKSQIVRDRLSLLLVLAGVAACSDAPDAPQQSPPAAAIEKTAPAETVEITWEELMPEGEEDRLTELYTSYYEAVEQAMSREADAAGGGGSSSSEDTGDTQDLVATIAEGSAADTMEQIGTYNVVEALDGMSVRLPGYVVPFDFSAEAAYGEFLLVPYFGACLHSPPPPPNQIVFVKAEPAARIQNIFEPVWVEGTLKTGRFDSELANSAYELTLDKVEVYEY